ncbi:MAG: lysozyme [Planctomycetota bacterium]
MLRVALVIVFLGEFPDLDAPHAELRTNQTCPDAQSSREAGARGRVGGEPAAVADSAGCAQSSTKPGMLTIQALPVTGASNSCLQLIKNSEGFLATPRWDRTQWSVGYGTRAEDPNVALTENRATELLEERVGDISRNIIARSKVPLLQDHVDALTSLAYNVGESALLGTGNREPSTLWKKLQVGDFEGAAAEFQRWNKAGGVTLRGLTTRRRLESELFRRGSRQVD